MIAPPRRLAPTFLLLTLAIGACAPAARGDEPALAAAVGRVEIGAARVCTGALIGADLVLTAAHCLHGEGGLAPPEAIRFVPSGSEDGPPLGVVAALASPAYEPARGASAANAPGDVAVLRLAAPVPDALGAPHAVGRPPQRGERVVLVAYGAGRHAPAAQACTVIDARGGALVTDCAVSQGASGGPFLTVGPEGARVVSVVAGGGMAGGRPVALGADLGRTLGPLLARAAARAPPAAPRRAPGARFVRP